MPYNLNEIDFSAILGGQGGGQNLANIVGSLGQMLMTGGHMGAGHTGSTWGGVGGTGTHGGVFTDPYDEYGWAGTPTGELGVYGDEYNLENVIASLESYGGETVTGQPNIDYHAGYTDLASLLESLNLYGEGSLISEYGQNVGDIRSEVGAQMKGLTSGLTGGKAGRYGGLGTMARNLGEQGEGGRQKYMADIYGLQQQQGEMVSQTQQDLEQDFMTAIANWQAIN